MSRCWSCLVGLGMRRTKIASGELTNKPALIACAKLGLPVVLSTGMANDEEVDWAIAVLREAGAGDITVLQCTSIYPAPPATANLRAMVAMGARNGVPFGYSDHTLGDHVALAAVALGASIIEKHFTLDRALPGPDHKASLTPDELAADDPPDQGRVQALGSSAKQPGEEELATAALVRRSWHAARNLNAGETLSEGDIDSDAARRRCHNAGIDRRPHASRADRQGCGHHPAGPVHCVRRELSAFPRAALMSESSVRSGGRWSMPAWSCT